MKKVKGSLDRGRPIPKRFLGAFKKGHRYSVRQYIDDDYSWMLLDRLETSNYQDKDALSQLEYLSKFFDEYYRNSGLSKDGALHSTSELRKKAYSNQNAINRDAMNIKCVVYAKQSGRHLHSEDGKAEFRMPKISAKAPNFAPTTNAVEDAVLALLDIKIESEESVKN